MTEDTFTIQEACDRAEKQIKELKSQLQSAYAFENNITYYPPIKGIRLVAPGGDIVHFFHVEDNGVGAEISGKDEVLISHNYSKFYRAVQRVEEDRTSSNTAIMFVPPTITNSGGKITYVVDFVPSGVMRSMIAQALTIDRQD